MFTLLQNIVNYISFAFRIFGGCTLNYSLQNLEACQYFKFLLPTFIGLYVASQTENLCIIFLLYVYINYVKRNRPFHSGSSITTTHDIFVGNVYADVL